ncbi:MAG: hypothetical protein K6A44_01180 [bacterium]|nr:hypothetical protein [bacterium]
MADSNGIPVLGGLFQIVKAPFKLVKSVGETGLAIVTLDGDGAANGLKGVGNSIFDVGEGAFNTVADVAGAGKSLFNAVHFDGEEAKKQQKSPVGTKDAGKGNAEPQKPAPEPKVTSPIEQKQPSAPIVAAPKEDKPSVQPPVVQEAPVVPPVEKEAPTVPPVVQEAPVVPPTEEAQPAEPPVAKEAPAAPESPKGEKTPEEVVPAPIDKAPAEQAPAPKAPEASSNDSTNKIIKYTLIGVGVVAGLLLLRSFGKNLVKAFSKGKDPMIDHTALYEALKGKATTLKAHQTVAGTVGKVTEAVTSKAPVALLPAPPEVQAAMDAAKKAQEEAAKKAAEEAAKKAADEAAKKAAADEAKRAAAPQVAKTKARLLAGEKLATPKSPIGLTDKYAALGEAAPKQVHNISSEEVAKLTERAQNKLYKERVTKEVREQAKARAKKAAAEAAKKAQEEAAKKAAEEAAQRAAEEAAASDAIAEVSKAEAAPQIAKTKARLLSGERLATPKSPIGLTDKYAELGEYGPKQVHNIGKDEITKLTEKAQNKLYKEKVTQEVREQAKARAKKAAADAVKEAQKAAEDAVKTAEEAAQEAAAQETAKAASQEAVKKVSAKETAKAAKAAIRTEIKDLKVSIKEMTHERTLLQKKTVLTLEETSRKNELTRLIDNAKAKLRRREHRLAKMMGKKVTISKTITAKKDVKKDRTVDVSARTVKKEAQAEAQQNVISIEELLKKTGGYEYPIDVEDALYVGSYIA